MKKLNFGQRLELELMLMDLSDNAFTDISLRLDYLVLLSILTPLDTLKVIQDTHDLEWLIQAIIDNSTIELIRDNNLIELNQSIQELKSFTKFYN